MLGEVQSYLLELGKVGGVVNREIAMARARGIVRKNDSRMLAENGGHVLLTKDLSHDLLLHMGHIDVRRKANSNKITVDNFEVEKYNFLCKIKGIVVMEEIPSSIIVNWNHTLKSVNKSAKEIPVN